MYSSQVKQALFQSEVLGTVRPVSSCLLDSVEGSTSAQTAPTRAVDGEGPWSGPALCPKFVHRLHRVQTTIYPQLRYLAPFEMSCTNSCGSVTEIEEAVVGSSFTWRSLVGFSDGCDFKRLTADADPGRGMALNGSTPPPLPYF